MESDNLKYALGSVIGAFIGDSLGSYIEFSREISPSKLRSTLQMKGGGPFNVGAGQVTDDSELAMCLLRGLLEGGGTLNLDSIAKYYKQWVSRHPFDIGQTTRKALTSLKKSNLAKAILSIRASQELNSNSKSNGSLMRCTPLAVFCRKISDLEIFEAASSDASLTHSNEVVHQIEACYIKAITYLINHPEDFRGAFEAAKNMCWEISGEECKEFFERAESGDLFPGFPHEGHVKIAFTHALRHLYLGSKFEEAMAAVLRIGGDTDTNACIVGGVIGAVWGIEEIPEVWKEKVMSFHASVRKGIQRPEFLDERAVFEQVVELYSMSPENLVVEYVKK